MKNYLFLFISMFLGQIAFTQTDKVSVEGAVIVGESEAVSPEAGTIQWTGTEFQGFDGNQWVPLGAAFDPSSPPSYDGTVITRNNVMSYTVPSDSNLYISDLKSSGMTSIGGTIFNGLGSYLTTHMTLNVGAGMTISNVNNFSFVGYLLPKTREYVTFDLENGDYLVPNGKTLFVTNFAGLNTIVVDGVSLFGVRVAYSGQTVSGTDGSIIGFLR